MEASKLEKYYKLMGEELFKRHLYLKSSEAKVAELVQRMENCLKEAQETSKEEIKDNA